MFSALNLVLVQAVVLDGSQAVVLDGSQNWSWTVLRMCLTPQIRLDAVLSRFGRRGPIVEEGRRDRAGASAYNAQHVVAG